MFLRTLLSSSGIELTPALPSTNQQELDFFLLCTRRSCPNTICCFEIFLFVCWSADESHTNTTFKWVNEVSNAISGMVKTLTEQDRVKKFYHLLFVWFRLHYVISFKPKPNHAHPYSIASWRWKDVSCRFAHEKALLVSNVELNLHSRI